MPRDPKELSLDAIWDLEDRFSALAGSPSGRSNLEPPTSPEPKTVTVKPISHTSQFNDALRETAKASATPSGTVRLTVPRKAANGPKKITAPPAKVKKG